MTTAEGKNHTMAEIKIKRKRMRERESERERESDDTHGTLEHNRGMKAYFSWH